MFDKMLITKLNRFNDKQKMRIMGQWTNQAFASMWLENLHRGENIGDKSRTIKKKEKRFRTAFSTEQIQKLERTFLSHKYITKAKKSELSNLLKLDPKCIKVWFQNRRMKEKRELLSEAREDQLEKRGNLTPEEFNTPVYNQAASITHSSPTKARSEHLDIECSNQYAYSINKSYNTPISCSTAAPLEQNMRDSGFYYANYCHYNVANSNQLPKYDDGYLLNHDSLSETYNFNSSSYSTNYYPVDLNYSANSCVQNKGDSLFAENHYYEPYHKIYYELS